MPKNAYSKVSSNDSGLAGTSWNWNWCLKSLINGDFTQSKYINRCLKCLSLACDHYGLHEMPQVFALEFIVQYLMFFHMFFHIDQFNSGHFFKKSPQKPLVCRHRRKVKRAEIHQPDEFFFPSRIIQHSPYGAWPCEVHGHIWAFRSGNLYWWD